MKIKRIEYKKLVSDGSYNNHSYGVVVDLEDGETEEQGRARAQELVDSWFEQHEEVRSLTEENQRLIWENSELTREKFRRESRIKSLVKFEQKIRDRLGLEPANYDEIPF